MFKFRIKFNIKFKHVFGNNIQGIISCRNAYKKWIWHKPKVTAARDSNGFIKNSESLRKKLAVCFFVAILGSRELKLNNRRIVTQ